jgi:SAM-dependent methyltransferase
MQPPALQSEFDRLGPWVTRFTINGTSNGGTHDIPGQEKTLNLFRYFPNARRILELGSLEGARAFDLAANPQVTEVIAIEGRETNLARARLIQSLYDQHKVRFVCANLETTDLAQYGKFDVVLCFGVLYHMPEPWKLIEQCAAVSPNLYIVTGYAAKGLEQRNGYWGAAYKEEGLDCPLSGLSPESFWLTLGSLYELLVSSGYTAVRLLANMPDLPDGPSVVLTAQS